MEIQFLKIIVLVTLFVSCLMASLLPLKFVKAAIKSEGGERRRRLIERVLRLLNCFGGGVFLATCLLDLLPDVEKKVTAVLMALDVSTNFPIAQFITAVGLFFILIVEQVAYDCKERASSSQAVKTFVILEENDKNGQQQTKDDINHLTQNETSPLLDHSHGHSASSPHNHDNSDSESSINTRTPLSHNHGHSHGALSMGTSDTALIKHTESHDMVTSSALRSLLLLLALSLHSLFEGLALGLQSDTDQLLGIFAAVVIHKTILALSLGVNFVQSNLKARTVIQSSVCFAIMAPIGIVVGIIVMHEFNNTAHNITSGVLQGLATGTFLYITFFEVLPMEMSQPGDRLLKVLCTILGFGMIVGTLFLDPNINKP